MLPEEEQDNVTTFQLQDLPLDIRLMIWEEVIMTAEGDIIPFGHRMLYAMSRITKNDAAPQDRLHTRIDPERFKFVLEMMTLNTTVREEVTYVLRNRFIYHAPCLAISSIDDPTSSSKNMFASLIVNTIRTLVIHCQHLRTTWRSIDYCVGGLFIYNIGHAALGLEVVELLMYFALGPSDERQHGIESLVKDARESVSNVRLAFRGVKIYVRSAYGFPQDNEVGTPEQYLFEQLRKSLSRDAPARWPPVVIEGPKGSERLQ